MGAWGLGNFDNDMAADWSYGLEGCKDLSVITSAIDAVFEDGYIDSAVGCEALAAIDVLARLNGKFSVKDSYTETVDAWVASVDVKPSGELLEKALKVLELIVGESSELAELWDESDEFDDWKLVVESLSLSLK